MRKKPKKNRCLKASGAEKTDQRCHLKIENDESPILDKNQEKCQAKHQSPDQKSEKSENVSVQNSPIQKINLNRRTKPRTTFLSNVCHVCKNTQADIICPKCQLIKYCSSEHRKAHWPSHADICQAIQQLKARYKVDHIFGHAEGLTPGKFREFRYNLLIECQSVVERLFELWEREIFLYPTVCDICYCSKTRACEQCSMVAFCQHHKGEKSRHEDWCSVLRLFRDFVAHEQRKGAITVLFPFQFSENYTKMPEIAEDFFDGYNFTDIYQRTQLTQIATAPLTILFGADGLMNMQLEKRSSFTVHLIGAEIEFELEPVHKWELFFQHLLPQLKALKLILIGPELYKSSDLEEFTSCSGCIDRDKTLSIVFESGLLYHEYVTTTHYTKPDIICIFNPGLSRSTGYNEQDSWPQTIDVMFREKVPVIMTAYTEFEIHSDLKRIKETVNVNILKAPCRNPYASQRPYRNFISDDCIPVIFKNYYMCVLLAETNDSEQIH